MACTAFSKSYMCHFALLFAESKALNDSDTLEALKLEDGGALYFKDLGEWTLYIFMIFFWGGGGVL